MNGLQEYMLCEKNTLENFIVIEENKIAYESALMAVEKHGQYNPIYIAGNESGLGVTHLLQGIAWKLKKEKPVRRFRYVDCDTFLSQYIDAITNNKCGQFDSAYTGEIDCFLFDGAQYLDGKPNLQNGLRIIFDGLFNAGKQIVFGGRVPCEIPGLIGEISSRLSFAVLTEIEVPAYNSRLALIRKFMEKCPQKIDNGILELIADNISGSISPLRGACERLRLHSTLVDEPVTVEKARGLLSDLFNASKNNGSVEKPNVQGSIYTKLEED